MEDAYGHQQIKQIDRLLRQTDDHSRCVYCGDIATCWDHVVPQSFVSVSKDRQWEHGVAPSCQECNGILSNHLFDNLDDRLTHVLWRVKHKYAKLIAMPEWYDPELKELGPNLRRHITKHVALKKWIHSRMRFLDRGDFDLWLDLSRQDSRKEPDTKMEPENTPRA